MKLTEIQEQQPQQTYSILQNEAVLDKIRNKATQSFKNFQRVEYDGFRMFEPKRRILFSEIEKMRNELEQLIGTSLYTRAYTYILESSVATTQETNEEVSDYTPVMQSVTFYIGQVPNNARVRYEIKT